jgi:hypothetical protein
VRPQDGPASFFTIALVSSEEHTVFEAFVFFTLFASDEELAPLISPLDFLFILPLGSKASSLAAAASINNFSQTGEQHADLGI